MLDELGELSLDIQPMLLRYVDHCGTIASVGTTSSRGASPPRMLRRSIP